MRLASTLRSPCRRINASAAERSGSSADETAMPACASVAAPALPVANQACAFAGVTIPSGGCTQGALHRVAPAGPFACAHGCIHRRHEAAVETPGCREAVEIGAEADRAAGEVCGAERRRLRDGAAVHRGVENVGEELHG